MKSQREAEGAPWPEADESTDKLREFDSDKGKVIAASVGIWWALQNGSHILLSHHRRLAIPVSQRRLALLESRPKWRRDKSEDSRMCDLFCEAQQFPTEPAISLDKGGESKNP